MLEARLARVSENDVWLGGLALIRGIAKHLLIRALGGRVPRLSVSRLFPQAVDQAILWHVSCHEAHGRRAEWL